jgi:hypothetical protein
MAILNEYSWRKDGQKYVTLVTARRRRRRRRRTMKK